MSITKINLPPAEPVDFNSGEIQYYEKLDPVSAGETTDTPYPFSGPDNRPLRNLSFRDTVISGKVDELIDQLNGNSTDKSGMVTQDSFSNYKVFANTPVDASVTVNAGKHILSTGKKAIEIATPTVVGPFSVVGAGLERYDLIAIDDTGTINIIAGTPLAAGGGTPYNNAPLIPNDQLALAIVKITEDVTVLVDDVDITDIREFLNKGGQAGEVLITGADIASNFLGAKLVAGANISFNVLNPGANEVLEIVGSPPGVSADELAKISGTDTTAGFLGVKLIAGTNITFNTLNPGANETLEINASGGSGNGLPILPPEITNFKPDDTFPTLNVTLWGLESAVRFGPAQNTISWFSFNKPSIFPTLKDILFNISFVITTNAVAGDLCRFILDYWIVQDAQTPNIGTPTASLVEDVALTGELGNVLYYVQPLSNLKIAQADIPTAPCRVICRLTRDIAGAGQNYADNFDIVSLVPHIV